jgi:hypothetical protein
MHAGFVARIHLPAARLRAPSRALARRPGRPIDVIHIPICSTPKTQVFT